jgi:MFS transporter, ACDE family, multidrug resistance protein
MKKTNQKPASLLRDSNLHIIFLITLTAVLGVASITPAFPQIAQELNVPPQSIGLLIIVFTLPGVFLTPVLGVFADRVGRKRVLVPSLFLFGIAGCLCAFTRDFSILLILRFFQGVGAATLGSINITLIGDLFAGKQRAEAMGYNASVLSVSVATYPFIGGALATAGWFYPFYLPLIAIPIGLIVVFKLRNPEPKQTQSLRAYLKSALLSLKNRNAILYFATSMIVFIILYGSYLTYTPILLADRFSASSFEIGLVLSFMSVITAVVSLQAGRLAQRFGEKQLLIASFPFYAASLLLVPKAPSMWAVSAALSLFGVGQGINMPALQSLLTALAPIQYRAAFMSMNGMVLRIGQSLGPLIMGGFYMIGGVQSTFYAGAMLSMLMFLVLFATSNAKSSINEKK